MATVTRLLSCRRVVSPERDTLEWHTETLTPLVPIHHNRPHGKERNGPVRCGGTADLELRPVPRTHLVSP